MVNCFRGPRREPGDSSYTLTRLSLSLLFAVNCCYQFQLALLHQGNSVCRVLRDAGLGEAVQVEPMKSKLKAPGIKRWKLKYYHLVSSIAFKFNLRR